MNKELEMYARDLIKKRLKLCTTEQQKVFKRMYSPDDLEKSIDTVVEEMPWEKLDHALDQVTRTLKDNESQ